MENPSSSSSLDDDHHHDETPKGEREAVDELFSILVECLESELSTRSRAFLLRKFFAEVEKVERLQLFIVERLKQSKVKALTELYQRMPPQMLDQAGATTTTTTMRSVVESAEEHTQKLERFKVKTLDFGDDDIQEVKKPDADGSQNKEAKSS